MQPLLTMVVERLQELQAFFGPFVGWLKEWQFLLGSLIAGFAGVLIVSAITDKTGGKGSKPLKGVSMSSGIPDHYAWRFARDLLLCASKRRGRARCTVVHQRRRGGATESIDERAPNQA